MNKFICNCQNAPVFVAFMIQGKPIADMRTCSRSRYEGQEQLITDTVGWNYLSLPCRHTLATIYGDKNIKTNEENKYIDYGLFNCLHSIIFL